MNEQEKEKYLLRKTTNKCGKTELESHYLTFNKFRQKLAKTTKTYR